MFIQVIQGRVTDPSEIKAAMDRWTEELAPGAIGWLGSTAGATSDGTVIAIARFASADAARANSDRPEQHQWWMETSKHYTGDVTFHDCSDCSQMLAGGSDEAGFVQVIQGRVTDAARAKALMATMEARLPEGRPDVLGGTLAIHDDGSGGFTQTMYFTSEAAAREGEAQEMPADVAAAMAELQGITMDLRYLDLNDPWMSSPR